MDDDKLRMFSFLVFTKLEGAVTAGMIHLGDKLGLYRALRAAVAPMSSDELAERTALHERRVREWAYNQAAAHIIECDADERFSLSEEAAAVLANPDHPAYGMGMFHRFPNTMDSLRDMPESFRTGLGHDYDSHGPEAAVGIERSFEPWNRANLLSVVLRALDGIVEELTAGISVADVGCGAGGALLLMAARTRTAGSAATTSAGTHSAVPRRSDRKRARKTSRSAIRAMCRCPTMRRSAS
jgi:hypothetical protein